MAFNRITDDIEVAVFRSHVKIPLIFLVPAALLTTVYVAFYFYANSEAFERDLEQFLGGTLGGQFELGELAVSADLVRVRIHEVSLATPEGEPVVVAEEAQATLNPLMLLERRLYVSEVLLRGADVRLAYDEDDELNLLSALGLEDDEEERVEEDTEGSFAVEFADIAVEESRFEFDMGDFGFVIPQIEIPRASVAIEPDNLLMRVPRAQVAEAGFVLKHELMGLGADWGDWRFTLEDFDLKNWRWVQDGFTVERVSARSQGVEIMAQGEMAFPSGDDAPVMTYDGAAVASASYWSSLAQYFLFETVHYEVPELIITAQGDLEEVDAGARLQASVLETAGLFFEDVSALVSLQNHWVHIVDATASLHGGTVEVPYAWLNMYDVEYGVRGRFEGVSPRGVMRDFGVDLPFLDGDASGGIELRGGVPPDLEFDAEDPRTVQNLTERRYAEVSVTDEVVFEPAGPQARPMRVAQGSQFWVDPERVGLPAVDLRVAGDRVQIEDLVFDYERMSLGSSARGGLAKVRADLREVSDWVGEVGLSGGARVEASVGGLLASPEGRLRVLEQDLVYEVSGRQVPIEALALDAALRRGRLTLEQAAVGTSLGSVAMSGWIDLLDAQPPRERVRAGDLAVRGRFPARLEIEAEGVDVASAGRLLAVDLPLQGTLDATAVLEGSLENPEGRFEMALSEGVVAGQRLTAVTVEGALERAGVVIEDAKIDAGAAGRVTGRGRWGFDESYEFDLRGEQIALAELSAMQALLGASAVEGVAELRLHGAGSTRAPSVAGDVRLSGAAIGDRPLGDAALVVNTVADTVYITGAVLPWVTLDVEVPLDGESPYYARFGLEEVDLREAVEELRESEALEGLKTTGMVEVFVEQDLSRYQVLSYLTDLELRTMGRRIYNRGPLVFGVNNGEVVQIQQATLGSRDRFLSVAGAIILEPLLVDVAVDGALDLSLLTTMRRLFPDIIPADLVEARGELVADASFRGPPDQLVADGYLRFDRSALSLRDLADPVQITAGEVRFLRDRVVIPEEAPLRGAALGGLFRVHGDLSLADQQPGQLDLRLWSHNMSYRLAEAANLTFDTDIQVQATDATDLSSYLVSGGVDVLDGRFYRDISLVEEEVTGRFLGAFSRQTERYEAPLLEAYPSLREMRFDLAVRARDGFAVANEIDRLALDLELRIDLKLRNTLAAPDLSGDVDVVDGAVTFQGETFQVRTGTLRFSGEADNPFIDVLAGADVANRCREGRLSDEFGTDIDLTGDLDQGDEQEYHIILNIRGQADNLNVELDSTPYADQRDVLSLLLTGCTVDQLTASSAGGPTLEIALGPLLGRIERQIQDVVRVSEFSIMPGVERTQVRIGDALTRRLSWNFQLESGIADAAGAQRYEVEYMLSDRWSAELSERSQGEGSDLLIDLKLRYRLPLD